jgi:hypothetical protein
MLRFLRTLFQPQRSNPVPAYAPAWLKLIVAVTTALLFVNLYVFFRSTITVWPISSFLTGDRIASVIGTLLGILIGAWLAFRFATVSRELVRQDENVGAGNLALFCITTMFNQTRQYQKEIVDPYRKRSDAWFNMAASLPLNEKLEFATKDLSFIAQSDPKAFGDLLIEQERFRILAYSIQSHRDITLEKVWPTLSTAGIPMGASMAVSDVENILGPGLVKQLKVTTAGIINNVDENVLSLQQAFSGLRKALKRMYPHRKFIDFKFQ